MKVSWFQLMPYRFLPDDFEEKHSSVWVDVPSELFDPVKGHQLYNEFLDETEYADDMGSTACASTSITATPTA